MTALTTLVACIQTTTGPNIEANIEQIDPLLHEAVSEGASFLALPENAYFMRDLGDQSPKSYCMETHPGLLHAKKFAHAKKVWLLVGSVFIALPHRKRWANRSVLINPHGEVACHYDKIHLFDADFGDGESYQESATFHGGQQAKIAAAPFGEMGMSICYDIRFARLYRDMAKSGATVFSAPAAFAKRTGMAHWHVILRARAIENGCYVIAPGQGGLHSSGRETYGHSMIIDPWGEILAEADEASNCIITAEIDPQRVADVRRQMPVLTHDRDYVMSDYSI